MSILITYFSTVRKLLFPPGRALHPCPKENVFTLKKIAQLNVANTSRTFSEWLYNLKIPIERICFKLFNLPANLYAYLEIKFKLHFLDARIYVVALSAFFFIRNALFILKLIESFPHIILI